MSNNYTNITDVTGDDVEIVAVFTGDVSGSTWLMQWRTTPASGTVVATATIDTTDATTGIIRATVAGAVTAGLSPGVYYADLQRTTPGKSTWPRVAIRLEQDVSR